MIIFKRLAIIILQVIILLTIIILINYYN